MEDSNYSLQYHPFVSPLSQAMEESNNSLQYHPLVAPLSQENSYMTMPFPAGPHPDQIPLEFGGGTANFHLPPMELQRQHMQLFWRQQMMEVEKITDVKQHQLPLARIKKIMKSDGEVKMVSADAPVLFSKACELFIQELTVRSWLHAEEKKRRTIRKSDIGYAIRQNEVFDFLVNAVPMKEIKEEELGGNLVCTEPFPNNIGMNFPMMHANPINQAHGEGSSMSRPLEIFQQSMIQHAPMSTLTPTVYEAPQGSSMSRPQEIFQQSMIQQAPMSTLVPTVYEPPQGSFMSRPQEIFQQSMIEQAPMSTLIPTVYEPPQPYPGSMPPNLM